MIDNSAHRLRLTLRQLETFLAIAHVGSTHQATDGLARSQSAVSSALAELEGILGTPLFDRIGRRLRLNDWGSRLLPLAAELLDRAIELEAFFDHSALPPLRMGASFTAGEYLLPPLISLWQQQHPQARVQLDIGNTEAVLDALTSFEIDIGFIEGGNSRSTLLTEHWLYDELTVFAAPSHPLIGRHVSLADLSHVLWFLREPGSGTREATDRLLKPLIDHMHSEIVFGSNEALKNAVAAGTGVGCLSEHAVRDAFARGWLAPLQTTLPTVRRTLSIVTHRDRPLPKLAQQFMQHCLQ